jgi:hypothetical protein
MIELCEETDGMIDCEKTDKMTELCKETDEMMKLREKMDRMMGLCEKRTVQGD